MPFVARIDGNLRTPFEADETDSAVCPACGNPLGIRESHYRKGAFVARHFWHPTTPPDGCAGGPGGESAEHHRMKSIAASKAETVFPDATVSLEQSIHDRRADVLVEFDQPHPRFGDGLAIEVQHRHRSKDITAVNDDFHTAGYSVLWLDSDQYEERDVSFEEGALAAWWATQIPASDEWTGYHGVIHWLRQHLRPSVEVSIPFPDELYSPAYAELWAEALYRGYDSDTNDWLTIFSAPLFDSGRTRSELGLAMNGHGGPTVFLRKIQGENVELQDDSNLYRKGHDLKRITNILAHWDAEQRRDWADRTTNTRYGDWVTVEDTKTPIAHLKLLCHAESGNPTLTLDDHYEGDVSARVTPEIASESISQVVRIQRRIQTIRGTKW